MPDLTNSTTFPPFTPESEDRRAPAAAAPPLTWRQRLKQSGELLGALLVAGTFVGGLGATLGMKLQGPPQELARVKVEIDRRDSTLTVRVIKLEDGTASLSGRLTVMERKQDVGNYIQCVMLRRTDPTMLPDDCRPTLSRGAP